MQDVGLASADDAAVWELEALIRARSADVHAFGDDADAALLVLARLDPVPTPPSADPTA
ncbi:MAG: hypothetical protein U1F43_06755 [Myxococcota bacterium]